MKLFTKPFLALFALTAVLSSCDVEKLIDDNFKEKSLVVVAPDFIKNRVTVVFEDAETGEIIDEDLEVSVGSNKKIIDLSGHYKNTYTVKNGILQFAVDPNEEVTKEDPLYIKLNSEKVFLSNKVLKISKDKMLLRIPVSLFITQLNLDTKQEKLKQKTLRSLDIFNFRFNDLTYEEFNSNFYPKNYFKVDGFYLEKQIGRHIDISVQFPSTPNVLMVAFDDLTYPILDFKYDFSKENYFKKLEKDLVISLIEEEKGAFSNLENYKLNVIYNPSGIRISQVRATLHKDGKLTQNYYTAEKTDAPFTIFDTKDQYPGPNLKSLQIPSESKLIAVWFEYWTNDSNVIECEEGFNIKFEGLSEGEAPSLLYRTIRNGEKPTVVSYVNPTVGNEIHNTTGTIGSSHPYGRISNKIIFSPSFQYEVIPQEMDLGGEDACGKTYTFKVTPRPDTEKYKLNIQFQCAGEDFSTAPSVVAFIREEGSNASDLLNLNNGSSTLHLKSDKNYLVQGDFNGNDFGFTFTANGPAIDLALQKSILENENIQDIQYSFPVINGENVINAKVIFKEGKCPE